MTADTGINGQVACVRDWLGAERCVETHMSWLLFGAGRVAKLKKPLRTARLDFSTPAARAANARRELCLNRRLAPGVYLAVMALRRDGPRLAVADGDAADALDWFVLMRRLPEARMLDRLLAAGAPVAAGIDALGARLAGFYRTAAAQRGTLVRLEAERGGQHVGLRREVVAVGADQPPAALRARQRAIDQQAGAQRRMGVDRPGAAARSTFIRIPFSTARSTARRRWRADADQGACAGASYGAGSASQHGVRA